MPKILFVDIETAPLISYTWGLFDQNVALNQVKSDWHLLAWSAKWLDSPPSKMMYADQRNAKDIENDREILKGIWKLLDECDIVVTQNGKNFDIKKLNARFIMHGFKPPSTFKHIDTLQIARKHFGFTSNKLEYMSDKLCKKWKKLKVKKFQGFELWKECLAGNISAWKEMEKYNKYDVLALEELYKTLIPWDNSVNFSVYEENNVCSCGSKSFVKYGFAYTSSGKYQRLQCTRCGSELRQKQNLLNKDRKKSLITGTSR